MTAPLRAVPDAPAVTLTDAIEAWAAAHAHPEQAGTTRQYGSALRRLARDIGPGRDVASVTPAELAAWMREHHAGSKAATWNGARNAIRAAWKWWAGQGWARERSGPSWPVPARRKPRPQGRPLPGMVMRMLLHDPAVPLRERALWRLLYDTGCRISEALRLDAEDINAPGMRAPVLRKGSHGDEIVWGPKCAGLLAALLNGRDHGPVFLAAGGGRLSVRRAQAVFTEATAAMPGGPYHLHRLRHTQLSGMAGQGASTEMMKARSGHADARSLEPYLRVSADALAAWDARREPPAWDRDEQEEAGREGH